MTPPHLRKAYRLMADNGNTPQGSTAAVGGFNRRRLFTLAAGGAAAASGVLLPATAAQAHGELQTYAGIWAQKTVNSANAQLQSYKYRPAFHDKLDAWLQLWFENTPYEKPLRVWISGVHKDSGNAAQQQGRALDLDHIYVNHGGPNSQGAFQANYEIWGRGSGSGLTYARNNYWATAATLHYHFGTVLTYLNGSKVSVRVDNMTSGTGTTFFTRTRSQILHVQASCRYIWGKGTTIDGVWGDQAKQHSHEVLERIGTGGYLATSKSHWQAFNVATMRKGIGTETY